MAVMVFKADFDTKTLILGVFKATALATVTHAASVGCASAPVSPKWRTRALKGFCSAPVGRWPGMSMFSKSTEIVCDFPDPCTPHTNAENGTFYKFI